MLKIVLLEALQADLDITHFRSPWESNELESTSCIPRMQAKSV